MPISLDSNTGNIFAGGEGTDGDLVLRNNNGEDRIRLDGGAGNAWLGGHGTDGDLVMFPSSGDNATLAQASIHLDAGGGNIFAGGNDVDGDLVLRNGAGEDRIRLDAGGGNAWLGGNGADGDVVMLSSDGENRIRLDADQANMWIGGNGVDGDIVVFPSTGDNATLAQATIHLDGQSGDIVLQNADCAEDFDVAEGELMNPGSVVVIGEDGRLRIGSGEYDKRVVGVVAGAGNLKPGIILGRDRTRKERLPVALMGRVYCKADTHNGPIEAGDLLTTSATPGHVMKATDPLKAFGAVVGKALTGLSCGVGLIQVLIALQ
jgi:hypothetical protein